MSNLRILITTPRFQFFIHTSFFLGCATHGGAATINPPFFILWTLALIYLKQRSVQSWLLSRRQPYLIVKPYWLKSFSVLFCLPLMILSWFFHFNFVSITANFGWEGTKLIWFNLFKVLFLNSLALLLSNEVWKLSYLFYTRHTH